MIKYKSTRGDTSLYTFSEAVLKGIAKDGGLFVPQELPRFSPNDLQSLLHKSYQERASYIINLFQTDFAKSEIETIIHDAYGNNFDTPQIAPLVHLKANQYLLELWHGPTAAFKDMALQLMPLFFQEAIKKNKSTLHYLILAATSGDTGKAAAEGFKNKAQSSLIVFYPARRVSQIQELQMRTQEGENVVVYAVDGGFDAVQNMVKEIFNDKVFEKKLHNTYQTVLSAANSINWGRLIAQIIYHVTSYLDLVDKKIITLGQEVDIAVPSGNFGNILAAFYTKKMGLPIRRFICASNENNALTKFLQSGTYDIQDKQIIQTPSPAMDILIASNIERLLLILSGDPKKVAGWMEELKEQNRFEVDDKTKRVLQEEFYAGWVTNEDCLINIRERYEETNYLMDPHTSVAQLVVERYLQGQESTMPIIISSTAHWAKFPHDVYKALAKGDTNSMHNEFELVEKILKLVPHTNIPHSISSLKDKPVLHNEHCKSDIKEAQNLILRWLDNHRADR